MTGDRRDQLADALRPISMEDAVGYPSIDCAYQGQVEDALVLKHDRLFLLTDGHGDIAPAGRCALGLFFDDTRILSHYELRFAGGDPALLSAQVTAPYHAVVDLAITDQALGGDTWDPRNVVHIRRELLLSDRLEERLFLTSYLPRDIDFDVELALGSDFADMFEVRGWKRDGRGQFFAPVAVEDSLTFAYEGRDGTVCRTRVRFAPGATSLDGRGARWRLRLRPGAEQVLRWAVLPADALAEGEAEQPAASDERLAELGRVFEEWRAGCSVWRTDVAEFDTTLDRAVDDLRALYIHTGEEEIISAGIPWYTTAFGRDSIITSLQTLSLNPDIARDTLRYLARHQGTRDDAYTEEQPGKIMHELRRGEMARSGEIPHVPYYGTIDATPLWVVLLHETWRWTGDADLVRELLPAAERAVEWIDRYGDLDGDGFVEYARTSEKGLVNQGWKDSGDGVPFPDGALAEAPIALVEVQGYVYDAKARLALLYDAFGEPERAMEMRRACEELRERIWKHFWMEDAGTFALALDGAKRPVPSVTSNAGHLLWSRVPDARQAARMARVFSSAEMFSGWGIRTLSTAHPVYNPMSYHNGSVWPHDNALVVLGLALYGHAPDAVQVVQALHDAATPMPMQRLPELFCGMHRTPGETRPVLYPVSCSPQAWASGAFFMLLQAALGLFPDAPRGVLHIREPHLPPFLSSLTLRGLQVGGSRVALEFRRHDSRTLVNLLAIEGDPLHVRIELK